MSSRSLEPPRSFYRAFKRRIQQQIESQPRPEPEDSLGLRVLVQLLVAIGIIAVDVAAADAADALGISFWAVPVSFVGATWSWYRRRSRNIPVKFCIAIAMLVALAAFFTNLFSFQQDTRLVLAELLIQLQVFHSFDLPRRKDLGYSIVIGLILIGVAATISQTLAFAPMLLLFLAIALPVLVLDYRSRLGLVPQQLKNMGQDLSLKRLGIVLLVVLALGLSIFAFLPRFPGYQLRTFPVSAPIEFEGEFDGTNIVNSGYVREGRLGNGTGAGGIGNNVEEGPGELDSDFYYGFNSRINQNLRGALKPKVVMRVRSQSPGFWRVMAFDRYTGQGWEVTRNQEEDVQKVKRPRWTFRFELPWSVTPNRSREVIQSYTVVSDLPNLIPTLYEPKQLYFPTSEVAIDPEGSLRSPVPLSEGLTYTVVSAVPFRDRTRLRDARQDYPPEIRDHYLQVPDAIARSVRQVTEEALASSPVALTAPSEKALYLAQYLKQRYRIQQELPFLEEDEDLVSAFLLKYEGGYPDHFATVLTMMLRSIDIPARLVVGFGTGEFNPFTGFYVIRNTDAFAMTEVYFDPYGWFTFDAIPGHEVVPASIEETQTFSVLQQFWSWIAGWLPSPITGFLSGVLDWVTQVLGWAIASLTALFSRGLVGLLLGLGILTGASFLGWLSWNGFSLLRYRRWLGKLPPMEALYQEMLQGLSTQGFRKPTAQTPLEYAQQLREHQTADRFAVIDEISQAYVRWRYGRQVPDLSRLRQRLKTLQKRERSPLFPAFVQSLRISLPRRMG